MKTVRMEYKHCALSKAVCIDGDTVNFDQEEHEKKFLVFADHTRKKVVKNSLTLEFPNSDTRHMFFHQLEDKKTLKDALTTLKDMGDHYHHVAGNKMLMSYLENYLRYDGTFSAIDAEVAHEHKI